ncbi:heavy metal-associated isoprenylated plant protein 41-like [Andrographis paniculata]|uniref:heavy metal-associated isoprenylated plant protein 41-like n=1 Tax=Andrographis paniculata TaxID=175694 RepID=UPI0021E975B1|nr:heavy metal-associated isoprenylated plant protein 41-like [Andrographis paniculata]
MEATMAGLYPWGRQQRWIKHYSSIHDILLVGEGDFSFSLCLAIAFATATNIVTTSLDTYDDLLRKYPYASENLAMLGALGASLMHGVDATKMSNLDCLRWKRFHRIIFNFPHAGFLGKEDSPDLIKKHRELVRGFLMNASRMLWPNGEIHINHKITLPFSHWKIEDLAPECSLTFIGADMFRIKDYPGYENKRGSGLRPNDQFRLGECRTFKFKPCPSLITTPKPTAMSPNIQTPVNLPPESVPFLLQPQPSLQLYDNIYSSNEQTDECWRIFGEYLNHVEETFGSKNYDDAAQSIREALKHGYQRYMSEAPPGRRLSGYISILEELYRMSSFRLQKLKERVPLLRR